MVPAHGKALPYFFVSLDVVKSFPCATSENNADNAIPAVRYKMKDNRSIQAEWHEKVRYSDSRHSKADWREDANLSNDCSQYRQEFI